jgi:hypothetical protein
MLDFTLENISAEEVERLRAVYEPLAQSVREFIDATVRTQVDVAAVAAAKAGHLADEEGVTVEAEGVFIQPRWARDRSD